MYLSTVRGIARRRLRSGNDSVRYQEIDLDDAFRLAGNEFTRRTNCTRSYDSLAIVLDTETVDISALTGFRPDMIIDEGIRVDADANYSTTDVYRPLRVVNLDEFNAAKVRYGTTSGTPRLITFPTFTTAKIFPVPKATGTMHIHWTPPLTVWTPGVAQVTAVLTAGAVSSITIQNGGTYATAPTVTFSGGAGAGATATATLTTGAVSSFTVSAGGSGYTSAPTVLLDGVATTAVLLNIPDDMIDGVIQYGVPVFCQWNELEVQERDTKLENFEAHIQRCMGAASLGVRSIAVQTDSCRDRLWPLGI